MTMRFIPFFISLVFAIPATAQETYEDIKRRQENKAYNEAYIDALRRPNTKTTNSGAIDQKAAQELADLFAARAGKETAAQKAAREKMEQERYDAFVKKQEAAYQEYRRQADTKQAEEDMIYGPFRKKYELAGFSFGEAEFLALDAKGGHFPAALALQQFNETVGTAGFEDLFHLVNDFKFTGYSAMKAVDQLKKRFPEKKVLLDAAAINLMIGSWTARVGTRYAYSFLGKDIQSKMLNYFEEAYDKNPELVFAQINAFRLDFFNNPFQLIAYEYSTKKKNKQAEKFRDLNGRYVMHVLKGPIITDRTIPGYFGDAYRYVGGYKITADDLR
ncbi:MAG TPA: hypothetical protein VHL77_02490, partial [Ferruginibacter sp.]|nr:hypothetical protein [Ferruginibacter sp.]